MRRRAFTLIELLMVVLIMGVLGTVTVGGYRAMQRGMEERGVMENVNHFIRSAFRRAQIDRQPVAVFYWNELLRAETDTESLIVVGKAVAVRRAGRVTSTDGGLCDEFADLDKERLVVDEDDLDDDNTDSGSTTEKDNWMAIYKMNSDGDCARQLVSQTTKPVSVPDVLPSTGKQVDIQSYAYVPVGGGGNWKIGDAYGFEFAEIQLPHGYTFGSEKPTQAGGVPNVKHLWFEVSPNSGSGANQGSSASIEVYCLRPNNAGELEPKPVAKTKSPKGDL